MKKFSSVFSCFHTDIMNKYIFPVQQKISWKFSVTYFSGKATSLPLSQFVTHPGTPPKVRHPIFIRPSTKTPDNNPLYKFSLSCSWGFCQRVFSREGFVRCGFCPFPLLSEYICYNRTLNITLNFRFYMHDKKFISVMSQALDPLPHVTNCQTFSDPSPSSVTYFMNGPLP